MTQINFPTATADGQTFTAPNGVIYTYVGTPPNGYWSGTFQTEGIETLDGRYLKLDTTNDPLTGDLQINTGGGGNVQIKNADGSALSGSISLFRNDSDFGAKALIASSTDGELFNVKYDGSAYFKGKVGINTTAPGAYLEVLSYDVPTGILSKSESTQTTNVNKAFIARNNSATDTFSVSYLGEGYLATNLGVGEDSPESRLHVTHSNSTTTVLETTDNQSLINFRNSSTDLFYVGTTGNNFNVQTGGTERLSVTTTGNVGVGVVAPVAKLDVRGSIISTQAQYANNQDVAYMIAGTQSFTGSTTNWGSYGFQHKLKTTGTGVARTSIDGYAGEIIAFSQTGDGESRVGIGTISPEAPFHLDFNISSGGFNTTAIFAKGADANFQLRVANGSDSNASGEAVSRFGMYYKTGASLGWDSHIDFVRGNSAGLGALKIKSSTGTIATFNADNTANFVGSIRAGGYTGNTAGSVTAPSMGIVANACIFTLRETGSPNSSGDWAIVRDSDTFSIRWKNAGPYALTASTNGAGNANEVKLRGTGLVIDSSNRVTIGGTVSNATGIAGSCIVAGRAQFAGVVSYPTSNAANVYMDSTGKLLYGGSSARYKTQVETMEDSYADSLLNVRPVWFRSTCEADNPDHSFWGFIAEEVAEIDPRLVHYDYHSRVTTTDENGDSHTEITELEEPIPNGIAYDRFVPALVNVIKRQRTQIEDLAARVAALEA